MVLTQITNLHANGGLNRVENETLGIYQIGNLDTRRINVGAKIKRVRVQDRIPFLNNSSVAIHRITTIIEIKEKTKTYI